MSKIEEYHRWLRQRALKRYQEDDQQLDAMMADPRVNNADLDRQREIRDASYDTFTFVELSDPAEYAAHKRIKRFRKEEGL